MGLEEKAIGAIAARADLTELFVGNHRLPLATSLLATSLVGCLAQLGAKLLVSNQ